MDFARYVESFEALYINAKGARVPTLPPLSSIISFKPERILILAPHPDDECLMSGFAVRAQTEFHSKIFVTPFSYGSKSDRQAARKKELVDALQVLDFELVDPRVSNSTSELSSIEFKTVLEKLTPDVIITTHLKDGHPAHIRSSEMAEVQIRNYAKGSEKKIHWLQTEFWQSMEAPNLLVPLSSKDLSKMGSALIAHTEEVKRNPYHLTLPAWAMDQARRGSEMAVSDSGGKNAGSPKGDFVFGQIYRMDLI